MSTKVLTSSASCTWYTPSWLLDRVRLVLGRIDLDPASDETANRTAKADRIITEDGVEAPWLDHPGAIFCNPPGRRSGAVSVPSLFWARLMREREDRKITHAIFLSFTLNSLQTTQRKSTPAMGEFPCCILKKRVIFESPERMSIKGFTDVPSARKPAPSPHPSAMIYVPGIEDRSDLFEEHFSDLGTIMNRRRV